MMQKGGENNKEGGERRRIFQRTKSKFTAKFSGPINLIKRIPAGNSALLLPSPSACAGALVRVREYMRVCKCIKRECQRLNA
jgi:hypothetical protein